MIKKFFKKKKKKKGVPSLAEMTARVRGFILDSQIQDAHELTVLLGCSPISDDVAQKEEEESDKRVERISYLVPVIFGYAHMLSEAATEFQKQNAPDSLKDIPKEAWVETRRQMEQINISVLVGAISQLVDMELLAIPKKNK
jgi:hypothetical protein